MILELKLKWSSMLGSDSLTNNITTLNENQTEVLFKQYVETKDISVRDLLVSLHQNLVRFLAGKFANRGEPLDDLIQVGSIGLINAIERFDPERGTKFSTYATPTIVGEIRRHFRDKAWSLKVPRRLQELNLAANRGRDELSRKLGRNPSVQEIAEHIGITEEETLEAIELGNAYDTVSLDTKLSNEGESAQMTLAEFVGGEDTSLQNIETYGDLEHAMAHLEPRERTIIYYRFFKDMSQTDVANHLNISQMHVSRLQQKALKKMKDCLSS